SHRTCPGRGTGAGLPRTQDTGDRARSRQQYHRGDGAGGRRRGGEFRADEPDRADRSGQPPCGGRAGCVERRSAAGAGAARFLLAARSDFGALVQHRRQPSLQFGSPRENTLGLRAVAGSGEGFRCGVHTSKGATGYDLTRLLIGSEGTLALITEATLKLTPKPSAVRTLRATYRDVGAAARAVARIMAQPVTPCALEFIDDVALKLAHAHGGDSVPLAGAMLMIEVDGEPATLPSAVEAVSAAARGDGLEELRVAATDE